MQFEQSQFEMFVAPSGRTTPYMTLDLNARMYFSSAATKAYDILDSKHKSAQLFFSTESNIIAIKLLNKSEEGTLPLKSPKQGGTFINAKSFAIKYEMMEGDKLADRFRGKYLVEKGEIEGIGQVFFIKLNEKK